MPDELELILDAWGRRQASPGVLPRSPSPAFLARARRTRIARRAAKCVVVAVALAAIAFLLVVIVQSLPAREPAVPAKAVEPR